MTDRETGGGATQQGAQQAARQTSQQAAQHDYLLEVNDLKTYFQMMEGVVKAVDGASFKLRRGRTLAIVGESGCGKSITARSIMQIVGRPGRIVGGEILYHRRARGSDGTVRTETVDLARLSPGGREMRSIRGREITMIFQEPMTSFSPVHTIGNQIMEAILLHQHVSKAEARNRAIEVLRRVGMPQPQRRVDEYPHQISGGMRQRAMIAMALSCNPALLIADEPTTALDVTTQAQILELLMSLKADLGMSIILITHDLGVVAETADDVAVMYLGKVVERADVDSLFYDPKMPYTQALLRSIPQLGERIERLEVIRGMVPDPYNRPRGCPFHPRCPFFMPGYCDEVEPPPIPVGASMGAPVGAAEAAVGMVGAAGGAGSGERDVRCLLYGGAEHLPGYERAVAEAMERMGQGATGAREVGKVGGVGEVVHAG